MLFYIRMKDFTAHYLLYIPLLICFFPLHLLSLFIPLFIPFTYTR